MVAATVSEGAHMKIYVSSIPEEGLKQHATYDPSGMDMDREDIHLTQPFEAHTAITLADRELVVQVDIRVPLRLTCARCLEEFSSIITTDGVFSYKVQPAEVVDITDDVRQEIILAYPMIPMCVPHCKGLCSSCGQNLNVALCSHQATSNKEG